MKYLETSFDNFVQQLLCHSLVQQELDGSMKKEDKNIAVAAQFLLSEGDNKTYFQFEEDFIEENIRCTVRPTKPDDPLEDVPPTISKLLPEEITPENYKAKVQQFERELTREMKTPEKEPAPTVKTEKKK